MRANVRAHPQPGLLLMIIEPKPVRGGTVKSRAWQAVGWSGGYKLAFGNNTFKSSFIISKSFSNDEYSLYANEKSWA